MYLFSAVGRSRLTFATCRNRAQDGDSLVCLMHDTSVSKLPHAQVLKSKGVLTGVKTDKGLAPIPGSPRETTTRGMDTLLERSKGYYQQGARFAKW